MTRVVGPAGGLDALSRDPLPPVPSQDPHATRDGHPVERLAGCGGGMDGRGILFSVVARGDDKPHEESRGARHDGELVTINVVARAREVVQQCRQHLRRLMCRP